MSKKLTALLLVLAMMLAMFTGCGDAEAPAADEEEPAAEESTENTETPADTAEGEETGLVLEEIPQEAYDDPVAYVTDGAIKKDDTIATVNGLEVKADEFFAWLTTTYSNLTYTYYYYGMELNASDVIDETTGTTVGQYLVNQAAMMAEMYTLTRDMAADAGLALSQEQQDEMAAMATEYDAETALYYVSTIEAMQQTYADSSLIMLLRDHLYGEGGELEPTEATLADYAASKGSYNCRYILQRTDELAEDDTEGREAKRQQAETLYNQLLEVPAEELETQFAALQAEYNDDGNTEPFVFDDTSSLVGGFREKLAELEDGQIGLTEETDYGYFVVLRLPVDVESMREDYIAEAYDAKIVEWMDAAEIELSGAFMELDVAGCFERLDALQTVVGTELAARAEAETETETETDETADETADAVG